MKAARVCVWEMLKCYGFQSLPDYAADVVSFQVVHLLLDTIAISADRQAGRQAREQTALQYTVIQNIPFKISRHATMFMANVF